MLSVRSDRDLAERLGGVNGVVWEGGKGRLVPGDGVAWRREWTWRDGGRDDTTSPSSERDVEMR